MAIVPLKCPKCGAGIQLDDQQETSICPSCGGDFPFREAVQKYMGELAGKLRTDDDASRSPVVFTTTTTTTVNGKTTTVNGQNADFDDIMSKIFGSQSGSPGFGSEPIPGYELPIPGYELPENAVLAIRLLVANDQKIQAIKVFRQYANVDLEEAKNVIESLETGSPAAGTVPLNMNRVTIQTTGTAGMDSTDPSSQKSRANDPNLKVSRCYIATAVYGSYDAPQVIVLRRFRDEVLSRSLLGRAFIRTYYAVSPPVAKRLENAGRMNRWVRRILDAVVRRLG